MSSNRFTIYLRPKRDRDIIEYINSLEQGDRSNELRRLIRIGFNNKKYCHTNVGEYHTNVIQSNTQIKLQNKLKEIEVAKVEISDAELDERLDNF